MLWRATRENGKRLGHVTCGYGTLMEHLKHLGLTYAIQRCENRKATNVVFMHITCRVTISNDFQPFVKAGQLSQVNGSIERSYSCVRSYRYKAYSLEPRHWHYYKGCRLLSWKFVIWPSTESRRSRLPEHWTNWPSGLCNPETAKDFGERFLPKLDDIPYNTTIIIKRSKMVKSLAALKPRVGSVASLSDNIISVWPTPIVHSAHFVWKQKS